MRLLRRAARTAFLLLIFAAGYGMHMLHAWYHAMQCLPEPTETQVLIADTHWIAHIRGMACGFGLSEMTDIQVVRTDGSDPIVIATGSDVDQATLDGSTPHELRISLSEYAQVGAIKIIIPDLKITWIWQKT